MPLNVDNLRKALDAWECTDVPALPGRSNHLRAGVLVPVIMAERPEVLLTLRSPHIRHGGEVSFPGGRPEPDDLSMAETALREAREELGIEEAEILGQLSSMPVYTSDHRLEPFVAAIDEGAHVQINPDEVSAVLHVDLRDLLFRSHIDAISWDHDGLVHLSPIFVTHELAVFGATAHTLLELLAVVGTIYNVAVPELRPGRFVWKDMVRWRANAAKHR